MRALDLTNQRFGKLTVICKLDKRDSGGCVMWLCQCDCGNTVEVRGSYLKSDHTTSCGCNRAEAAQKMGSSTIHDLTNLKFGKLTVLRNTGKKAGTNYIWECQCECGKIHEVAGADLVCGKTKSCGCQRLQSISKAKTIDMIGRRFGKLIVLSQESKDSDGSWNYLCQCDCGNQKIVNGVSLRNGATCSCGCLNSSIGETNINNILVQNNIVFKREYSFDDLGKLRFDFALLEDNKVTRLIEFDGRQHYEENNYFSTSLEDIQQRDKVKNEYALSHNIPLVRIPYWERDNITLDMLLGDKYLI